MVDFITRTVGWKIDGRYNALCYAVNEPVARGRDAEQRLGAQTCAKSSRTIRSMRVLIAHGWDDLSCPFMASLLIVDQMPAMGDATACSVKDYPGGHMFYARPDSQAALTARRARAVRRRVGNGS